MAPHSPAETALPASPSQAADVEDNGASPVPAPERVHLSAEEARRRVEDFASRRKEKMIASVRKNKG